MKWLKLELLKNRKSRNTYQLNLLISKFSGVGLLLCVVFIPTTQAENEVQLRPSEPATSQTSYEERVINSKGVHNMDPNVYVYTSEFANRFQMPNQWISADLKGAEAVAFRVVPSYKSCGWGGNPQTCREDEVRCEMDVYFDHKKQALPWDERFPAVQMNTNSISANFLGSLANQELRRMRPKDRFFTQLSPFVHPKTGKGLGWQGGYWYANNNRGPSFITLLAYHHEVFKGVSMIVLGTSCFASSVPQAIWLDSENIDFQEKEKAFHVIDLPPDWQTRVKQNLTESDQRSRAFFKQQGEKALNKINGVRLH